MLKTDRKTEKKPLREIVVKGCEDKNEY